MNIIEIKNVTKDFKETRALDNIELTFEENKIYGLLGRNGAGKSTLLNIINNRILSSRGTVALNGDIITENDQCLCSFFLVNEKNLYPESMKVKEALKWTKEFYPDFDTDYAFHLAEQFELPVKTKIKNLSTGYQSIFKNILALSVNVPFIFFDEPVLGLDAYHRELFYKILIQKYSEQPFTAVISTHLIEEISSIIENVIIIKKGKIVRNDTIDNLLSQGYSISGISSLVDNYIKDKEVISTESLGGLKTANIIGKPDKNMPSGLEISQMDLQKLFIQLTNS